MAAFEERLGDTACLFDVYVGCSAGSVVASLLASRIRASEIYNILDQDLDDPLNLRRGVLFADDTFRVACERFGRYPRTHFHLLQPARDHEPLFGPSMGFEAGRAALRLGRRVVRAPQARSLSSGRSFWYWLRRL